MELNHPDLRAASSRAHPDGSHGVAAALALAQRSGRDRQVAMYKARKAGLLLEPEEQGFVSAAENANVPE